MRRIAPKQAGIGLWATPAQLRCKTACRSGPQRRVSPFCRKAKRNHEARSVEPIRFAVAKRNRYLPRSAMRMAISLSLMPTMASPRSSESSAMSLASV